MRINEHYAKLQAGYLFPEIARRVKAFQDEHADARVIKLGIGDVTEPLPPAIVQAMHEAVDEMGARATFKGYGPEQGYEWLREAIVKHDFHARGCDVDPDEVFVSDGSKCDTGNMLDVIAAGRANRIAVIDPVYPVYVDTNVMVGNTGAADEHGRYQGLIYLPATADNDFTPDLPTEPVDVVYLCYPNNPTGAVASKETLARWVEYARSHDAIILYDAAYEAYVTDPSLPRSIYEIPGARDVAVEFRSFSKNAGFTGTRCAYTVIPRSVTGSTAAGGRVALHQLWNRRQSTKFNGVSYIVQRGALAAYSDDGRAQIQQLVAFYLGHAKVILETFRRLGMEVFGGVNAPYVWLKTPAGLSSWDLFDRLLEEAHVVGTPGSGFGASGEGYFRISAFNSREAVQEAMDRIANNLSI